MIQPLSLIPRSPTPNDSLLSPLQRHRADSLVFSITSQKNRSPRDTILLESREQQVCKELEELQEKLRSLESKVQVFDSEVVEGKEMTMLKRGKEQSRFSIDLERTDPIGKENAKNHNNVGKIVRKDPSLSKTAKIVRMNSRSKPSPNDSRNSAVPSTDPCKSQEVAKLRKAILSMKQSMLKKQRSSSICSERLSESKSLVKSLRKEERRQEKLIAKLRGELKKSNHVRAQQKEVILRQQQEIAHYRELLKLGKSIR